MSTLVFLHTAPVHVQSFDGLLRDMKPGVQARHLVRADLLAAARAQGVDDPGVSAAVQKAVQEAAALGEVVLCTCSTIGGLAEDAASTNGVRVLRVDRPMARAAVEQGPRILVAAALESTVEPTAALIRAIARQMSRDVDIRPLTVAGAWECFEAGDLEGYYHCIAMALSQVKEADVIVLAQASMAGARSRLRIRIPVLASPELGLAGALSELAADRTERPAP